MWYNRYGPVQKTDRVSPAENVGQNESIVNGSSITMQDESIHQMP